MVICKKVVIKGCCKDSKLMFFITRYNLKIVISILIFTFFIINQVSIFNFRIPELVLRLF